MKRKIERLSACCHELVRFTPFAGPPRFAPQSIPLLPLTTWIILLGRQFVSHLQAGAVWGSKGMLWGANLARSLSNLVVQKRETTTPSSCGCFSVAGCSGLPIDTGRHTRFYPTPRAQRRCLKCTAPSVCDEYHLVFECSALAPLRVQFSSLFTPATQSMLSFMWQKDSCAVVLFVASALEFMGVADI